MLTLSTSLSSHISHDNRVSHRLVIGHYYRSRAKTQISLLIRGFTRVLIKETKEAETLIEIRLRGPSLLLLKSIMRTKIKKIRRRTTRRIISSTRMSFIITRLRKTFMKHLQKTSANSPMNFRNIRTTLSKLTSSHLANQLCSYVEFVRISLSLVTSFIDILLNIWSLWKAVKLLTLLRSLPQELLYSHVKSSNQLPRIDSLQDVPFEDFALSS